jgi:hypothetical protein
MGVGFWVCRGAAVQEFVGAKITTQPTNAGA